MSQATPESYELAVITPAFNEAKAIGKLAASIAAQTKQPCSWTIVDDSSTDNTLQIARAAIADLNFAKTISVKQQTVERSFGSKARAVAAGYEILKNSCEKFRLIACVDADIVLPKNYFEVLAKRFEANDLLGVAGANYQQIVGGKVVSRKAHKNHVPGAAQVFRREVFEKIGGYWELPYGGIDTAANYAARMHGWKTESFADLQLFHSRRMGSEGGSRGALSAEFFKGKQDWDLATRPSFELAKVWRAFADPPIIVGGLARWSGYVASALARKQPSVPPDFQAYARLEQAMRIRNSFRKLAV